MSKLKPCTFLAMAFAIFTSIAPAGTMVEVVCRNKNCDYHGQVNFGGAVVFEQITGYCVKEKKFVYLTWGRQGAPAPPGFKGSPPPEPMMVWNATTGETIRLYKCPSCGQPFLPIALMQDLRYCPKCNRPSLECQPVGAYDLAQWWIPTDPAVSTTPFPIYCFLFPVFRIPFSCKLKL
jgi:hypothetical protein